jgi:N-methylhydantoinase B
MVVKKAHVDPVTVEILRGAFVAITDEMKTNLMRTAYNPIIYEALDYTVGLFDRNGKTISIGLGLPMFIGGLSDAIKAKIDRYGHGGMEPGDILLTNDPYVMGSHLNNMIFTKPIFADGEVVAFAASMAHWLDIGGVLSGPTRDVYSEGLQLPIVKIVKAGGQDEELTEIIRANVRMPELALGDMRAQIASVNTGEHRFLRLMDRYGSAQVQGAIDSIFEQSEVKARHAVETIPDGVYEASSFLDDDGVGSGPIPIAVKVDVAGERMTIDLNGVSPQVAGYYNSGPTAGRSAAQVAFKCLTSPVETPINDGAFRPLEIRLDPGRIISANKPAAVRWWMTPPMTVIDTIFRALATAIPNRVAAAHHADLCVLLMSGIDPRSGRFFAGPVGLPGGGWGAKGSEDGVSATVCINDGDTHNSPIETVEMKMPILIERYALRTDSGGAGTNRGGLGVEQRIHLLADARVDIHMDRTRCEPWGLVQGHGAAPNRLSVLRSDGGLTKLQNGKLEAPLRAGDAVVVESGGGGGFGDPLKRPVDAVARDVRLGYVSREAAARDYGVVLDEELEPDLGETERTREALRALERSPDTAPTASSHDEEGERSKDALIRLLRVLFPHAGLGEGPYERTAVSILAGVAEQRPLEEGLHLLLEELEVACPGSFAEADVREAAAAVEAMSQRSAFAEIHRRALLSFYSDPEVWARVGYEGPSFAKGGYVRRGFDDLTWLPDPPV